MTFCWRDMIASKNICYIENQSQAEDGSSIPSSQVSQGYYGPAGGFHLRIISLRNTSGLLSSM